MAEASQRLRILIVGGMGYFGARLTEALCQEFEVTVSSRTLGGKRQEWLNNLDPIVKHLSYDSAKNDTLPIAATFDYVINLATPGSQECARDFEGSCRSALKNIAACIQLLKENRAQRLIHFSSFHVYGKSGAGSYLEEDEKHPVSDYGKVHREVEQWLEENAQAFPIAVVRPTNGVGVPAHGDLGVQSRLLFLDCCRQAAERGVIQLTSDGIAYRDFVPLPDFISAIKSLLIAPLRPLSFYNLASGSVTTLKDLAQRIQGQATQYLKKPIGLKLGNQSDPIKTDFQINTTKLRDLGWHPELEMDNEIIQTLAFFREQATGEPRLG